MSWRTAGTVVLLAVALFACGGEAAETAGAPALLDRADAEGAVPVVDLFEAPVPDHPDPALRAGAASKFIDCEHGIWAGGWSVDFGPPGSAEDPATALALFLTDQVFAAPGSGFTETGTDEFRRLFTYANDGDPKVAVIVVDGSEVALDDASGWIVETFASCDPAEFDPSADQDLPFEVWTDSEGVRVPVRILSSLAGSSHCDWQSVRFLRVGDESFVRDPDGVLAEATEVRFQPDTDLPPDAVDTGYGREGSELWIAADRSIAYLVEPDRVEGWPAPERVFGCD